MDYWIPLYFLKSKSSHNRSGKWSEALVELIQTAFWLQLAQVSRGCAQDSLQWESTSQTFSMSNKSSAAKREGESKK